MAYDPAVPTGIIPLNQDYKNLQENFSQLDIQFDKDHVPLTSTSGNPPNGYHTSIHMVPQGSITLSPQYGQLYSQNITQVTTDQTLLWTTGGGVITQLTVPGVTPNTTPAKGITCLPGGIIMQWGSTSSILAGGAATITFTAPQVNFPTAIFQVQVTCDVDPPSQTGGWSVSNLLATGFKIHNNTNQTITFLWLALGN